MSRPACPRHRAARCGARPAPSRRPCTSCSASSVFFLSGIGRPPRTPSSAVMMNLESASTMRPGEAVGREAAEHHRMHRADARAGQHGVGRLGDHRQVDGDAVALLDAVRLQHVGELAHPLVQLAIGDLLVLGRIVAFPDDGDLVAARLQMPVDAVGRDVERAVLVPLDRDVVGIVGGVLDLGVGLDPVDALADLAPEPVRVLDRALVHRQVLLVDPGAARPLATRYRMQLPRHRRSPTIIRCWRHYERPLRRRQFGPWANAASCAASDSEPADNGALQQQHAQPMAAVN